MSFLSRSAGRLGVVLRSAPSIRSAVGHPTVSTLLPRTSPILPITFRYTRFLSTPTTTDDSIRRLKPCWKCDKPVELLDVHCPKCEHIQPPPTSLTYFEALVGSRTFHVDTQALKRRFLAYQGKVHPDRYNLDERGELKMAEDQSSWINQGYRILKDPLSRAEYLLEINGVPIEEVDKSADSEMLCELMEVMEGLEEASTEKDLIPMKEVNDKRLDGILESLGKAFDANNLKKAKAETIRLRYFRKVDDAIHAWVPGKSIDFIQ